MMKYLGIDVSKMKSKLEKLYDMKLNQIESGFSKENQ